MRIYCVQSLISVDADPYELRSASSIFLFFIQILIPTLAMCIEIRSASICLHFNTIIFSIIQSLRPLFYQS